MAPLISTPIAAPKSKKKKQRPVSRLTEKELLKKGIEAVGASHYSSAIRIFENLTAINPKKGLYWFDLGNALFLSGEPIRSIVPYQRVVELKSPLAPVAWLYIAKAHHESKTYESAVPILNVLKTLTLPVNIAHELNEEIASLQADMGQKALEVYRANRFDSCIKLIDTATLLGSSVQLETLRGMALYQMGDQEAAKRTFQLVYYGTSDENQRRDARDLFFAASPQFLGRSPSTVFADLATGYNSNVFSNGSSEDGTSAAITSARISYNHGPAALTLSVDEALGVPEAGYVRTAGQWTFLRKTERWSAVLIPEASIEMNENLLSLARYGFGLGIETAGNRAWGAYVQLTRSLPLTSDSAFLLGVTAVEKFYWTYKRATSTFTAAFVFQEDLGPDQILDTGLLPLAGESLGPALTGTWSFAPRWEAGGFASYVFHPYNQPRYDRQAAIGTRFSYDIGRNMKATFSSQFVENTSTLGPSSVEDRNYVQSISQAGLTWELL